MRIDVIFDTVCPWCYIGKRRLDRALASRPDVHGEIRWRPFLLNPDMPTDGLERQRYLEKKFGGSYRIHRLHSAAVAAGQSEGIGFNFDLIRRTPSSVKSHSLVHYASGGTQTQLVESIFHAYFVEGLDIGDADVLEAIAEGAGLNGKAARDYLLSPAGAAAIEAENARMHRLGVNGVPCYIFDERYAVAGAQEPELLARLLDIAREAELEMVPG